MTDWVEHPDLPDLYYRRDGRTVHMAGRDVVYPPKRNSPDGYTAALSYNLDAAAHTRELAAELVALRQQVAAVRELHVGDHHYADSERTGPLFCQECSNESADDYYSDWIPFPCRTTQALDSGKPPLD